MSQRNDRFTQITMLVSLWVEDHPYPEISKRLVREFSSDLSESSFSVEEINEAIRLYRRDYMNQRRHFGFLWEKCKEVRALHMGIPDAGVAYGIVKSFKNDNIFISASEVSPEMLLCYVNRSGNGSSIESARRISILINNLGWDGIFTDNESSDRARFIQAYEVNNRRMTDDETWKTPDALLPDGKLEIKKLANGMSA